MQKQVELVTSMKNAVEDIAIHMNLEVKNVNLTRILHAIYEVGAIFEQKPCEWKLFWLLLI